MKFFKFPSLSATSLLRPHLFFFAFFLAASMWYFVVVHQGTSDAQVELLITYKNPPKHLYVTGGQVYSVHERIRGPKILIDKMPSSYQLPIDISNIKAGEGYINTFSVIDEQFKTINRFQRRAFEIISVDHPIIRLKVEESDRFNMPLEIKYHYHTSESLIVGNNNSQKSVSVEGPASEIEKLKKLGKLTVDVRVDLVEAGKGKVEKDIPVILPAGCTNISLNPPSVKVSYELKGQRINVKRPYMVNLAVSDTSIYEVYPASVNMELMVPADKQSDAIYLRKLRITALPPPDMQEGEIRHNIPLNFVPPEGMEIINGKQFVSIRRLHDTKEKEHSASTIPLAPGKKDAEPIKAHSPKKRSLKKSAPE